MIRNFWAIALAFCFCLPAEGSETGYPLLPGVLPDLSSWNYPEELKAELRKLEGVHWVEQVA